MKAMRPRIAIPVPHSGDPDYAARALPQYERAVEMAGGEPVRIPLEQTPADVVKVMESCDGVLLPGSRADVDPAKFGAPRNLKTADPDFKRDAVDELLLQEAYQSRKPVLGICYGLQILNVYRKGSLVQHIESTINHEAGRNMAIAHTVEVVPTSRLADVVRGTGMDLGKMPVNSSHHQSANTVGEGLRVVARCGEDGVVEGLEGTEPDHFVLGVQWHPERSVDEDAPSRAIFSALVTAAQARRRERDASRGSSVGTVP
jgi:putative glutamine amidotransferase